MQSNYPMTNPQEPEPHSNWQFTWTDGIFYGPDLIWQGENHEFEVKIGWQHPEGNSEAMDWICWTLSAWLQLPATGMGLQVLGFRVSIHWGRY